MKFKGNELILDNFRSVLSDYSVDVQDVVRSAILDGVDISAYIPVCKNNPLRLDQIRLGIKEGIDEVFLSVKSGECLYKIRKLDSRSLDLVSQKIEKNSLSGDSLEKLIDWVLKGYNIQGINVSIIPKSLYEVFEQGFQRGFDMSIFNDGRLYNQEYLKYCLVILSNGKDITPFVGNNSDLWSMDCIKLLASFSRVNSIEKWYKLISAISPDVKTDTLKSLISCVKTGIDIKRLVDNNWSSACIEYLLKAYESKYDYTKLIDIGPDEVLLSSTLNQMMLNKSKRVSGRLRKG
jgi:hypothetical protein